MITVPITVSQRRTQEGGRRTQVGRAEPTTSADARRKRGGLSRIDRMSLILRRKRAAAAAKAAGVESLLVTHLPDVRWLSGFTGSNAALVLDSGRKGGTAGRAVLFTDGRYTTQAKADPIEYIHDEIGYNYRLTNMQAAMGCAQLEQLGEYVEIKRRIARTYIEAFKDVRGITPMREAPWAFSNFWMFTVLVDAKLFGMTSRQLLKTLADKKIQSRPLWQPIHLSPAHADCQPQSCPTAETLYENCLSLPCSVGLSDAGLGRVVAAIRECRSSPSRP